MMTTHLKQFALTARSIGVSLVAMSASVVGIAALAAPNAASAATPIASSLDRYYRTTGLNTLGNPEQFWIAGNEVVHSYAEGGAWSATSSVGGPPPGIRSLQVGYDLNFQNNPELYVVGADGGVWHDYSTPGKGSGWSGWGSMGAPAPGIAGEVVVGRNYLNNQEIYVLGADRQVWHKYSTPGVGTGWSEWGPMGAPAPGIPVGGDVHVNRNNLNNQELYVASNDGSVWHSYSTPGQGTGWSDWSQLSSPPGATGDVAVWQNWANNQELFRVAGGQLWHDYATPGVGSGWSGWYPMGAPNGKTLSGWIGITDARSIGQLTVWVEDSAHQKWNTMLSTSSTWSAWTTVAPPLPPPPAVIIPGVIHAPFIGDRNIVEGTLSSSGAASVVDLKQFDAGVIHMPGTATLCSRGNPVLGAHRTTGSRPFYSLNQLTPGMTISASQNGISCTYKVVSSHVDYVGTAAAASTAAQDVLDQSPQFGSDHRLTLFACSLPNGQATSTTYRLIVNLVQV